MNNIEQKARELLAAEYERDGFIETAYHLRAGYIQTNIDGRALRAIIAALTSAQGNAEGDAVLGFATAERLAKPAATVKCDFCGVRPGEFHAFDCTALDASPAPTEGEGEAVAWLWEERNYQDSWDVLVGMQVPEFENQEKWIRNVRPLYTRPTAQVQQVAAPKVSEEDLKVLWDAANSADATGLYFYADTIRRVVQALEGRG